MDGWPGTIEEHPVASGLLQDVRAAAAAGLPRHLRTEFVDALRRRVAAMATGRPLPDVATGSDLERAVLDYAEAITLDPHSATDEQVAALTASLSPGEVVALTVDIGMTDGAARLDALLAAGRSS